MLVLKWIMVGYFLTMSYKSVLRSHLIHIEYEMPIDSIEDALQSQKEIFTPWDYVFSIDQRSRVRELGKRIKRYDNLHGKTPSWIVEG